MKAVIEFLRQLLGKLKKKDPPALPPAREMGPGEDPEELITTVRLGALETRQGDTDIALAEGHDEYHGLLEKEPSEKNPEKEGLDAVELVLKDGDSGGEVKQYQHWLERLGYELTRFGADGHFGDETLNETRDFQDDHDLVGEEDCLVLRGVGSKTYDKLMELAAKIPPPPPKRELLFVPPTDVPITRLSDGIRLYDITDKHAGKRRKRKRSWKDIKGITLHQTATNFGNNILRYKNIAAQIGVTPDGKVVLMNPLEWIVYHGNAFNSHDVGIECDGHFAGIEGDLSTYWRPKSKPNRMPMSVSEQQVKATLAAIEWIIKTVESHGGKVEYIHAHRQSSKMRTSDPGSKVWQRIALDAKRRWGLVDGGPDFKLGGFSVPREWDPSYTEPYRQW